MFGIAYYIGYFSIMAILLVVAITVAKKHNPWPWYVSAAVIQAIAFLGNKNELTANGEEHSQIVNWIIYAVLLVISAVFICIRIKNKKQNNDPEVDNTEDLK